MGKIDAKIATGKISLQSAAKIAKSTNVRADSSIRLERKTNKFKLSKEREKMKS